MHQSIIFICCDLLAIRNWIYHFSYYKNQCRLLHLFQVCLTHRSSIQECSYVYMYDIHLLLRCIWATVHLHLTCDVSVILICFHPLSVSTQMILSCVNVICMNPDRYQLYWLHTWCTCHGISYLCQKDLIKFHFI